jgi:hypothetical protein
MTHLSEAYATVYRVAMFQFPRQRPRRPLKKYV